MSEVLMLIGLGLLWGIYSDRHWDVPPWVAILLLCLGAALRGVAIWRGVAKDD